MRKTNENKQQSSTKNCSSKNCGGSKKNCGTKHEKNTKNCK